MMSTGVVVRLRVAAQEELGLLIADLREVEAVEVRRQDRAPASGRRRGDGDARGRCGPDAQGDREQSNPYERRDVASSWA